MRLQHCNCSETKVMTFGSGHRPCALDLTADKVEEPPAAKAARSEGAVTRPVQVEADLLAVSSEINTSTTALRTSLHPAALPSQQLYGRNRLPVGRASAALQLQRN